MGVFKKAADIAHKGAVVGLMSVFGFQLYQIVTNVWEGVDPKNRNAPNPTTEYVNEIREKASEDYKNYWKTDHRDWYDEEDNSHLKNAPRPNRPSKDQK